MPALLIRSSQISGKLEAVPKVVVANTASRLPVEALKLFVDALLEKLPQNSTPQVIVVKPEMPAPTPIRANGQRAKPISLTYDPSLVFVLEFVTILVARDDSTMKAMGKEVADALQTVIRDAPHVHPVTLSRAVYYLLSFLRASHVRFCT